MKLPLHGDTGAYVSNYTVNNKKINFKKSPHSTCLLGAKFVPELFYSLIYICYGSKGYKFFSRFWYSLYNFATGIFFGYLTYKVSDNSIFAYCIGLIIFALITSEPFYGVYFESAEQFEILFQITGILFLILGIQSNQPWEIILSVGFWWFGGYFIKLPSIIGSTIITIFIVSQNYTDIKYIILTFSILTLAFLAWSIRNSGRSISQYLCTIISVFKLGFVDMDKLWGTTPHSSSLTRRAGLLFNIWYRYPFIPILAGVSFLFYIFVWQDNLLLCLLIYTLAGFASYFIQGSYIWYHAIPLMPIIALFATAGLLYVFEYTSRINIWWGIITMGVFFAAYIIRALLPLLTLNYEELNMWVWKIYGKHIPEKNFALENIASDVRNIIKDGTIFSFGSWLQVYTLFGRSYVIDKMFLAVVDRYMPFWLGKFYEGWHAMFLDQIRKNPPDYMFDSENNLFNSEEIKQNTDITYILLKDYKNGYKLYRKL